MKVVCETPNYKFKNGVIDTESFFFFFLWCLNFYFYDINLNGGHKDYDSVLFIMVSCHLFVSSRQGVTKEFYKDPSPDN